jgi:HAD superfamily hydrolase (TIGR01490 family)
VAGIAFFDVDKTLLARNSARLWLRRELRLGHVTKMQVVQAGIWLLRYELGFARADDALRKAARAMRGVSERGIIDRTLDFWHEDVAKIFRRDARAVVEKHRAAGDLLFLLTSSSNYLAAPIADELQMDGFCTNRFEVVDGKFTGLPIEPTCYGPGKAVHMRAVCDKVGIALPDCTFYTDSFSDIDAMEIVGVPVAVSPDPRLRRRAVRRGWRIEDWGDVDDNPPPPRITKPWTRERFEQLKP